MMLPAYPKYKSSDVEWLGEVPRHWVVKRGRFCMDVNPRSQRLRDLGPDDEISFVPMEAIGECGGLRLEFTRAIADMGSGYTEFEDGDVIVAKITPCFENGKGALATNLLNRAAYGTTELHVLRAFPTLESRYLFYLTISQLFRSTGEGEMYGAGGQKRVPSEFCENFRVPLPSPSEQRTIADFLDRETARIDTLMAKEGMLIARLKEKRTALISRTVTHGLPPDAARAAGLEPHTKLKPSGIDWLGEVPESWTTIQFKRICRRVDVGIAEAATHAYCDDGVPIIRSTNVKPNRLDLTEVLRVEPWFAERNRSKKLHAGDLVTVRTGYPGTTAVIPPEFEGSQCFTLVMSTLKSLECPRFFSYFFNAEAGRVFFEMEGWGTAQTNISVPIVQRVPVVHPPPEEQRAIVDFLDCETAKIDQLLAKVTTAIECLREYRTTLITAAVTGTVDLRGVVA
ncbi:restriction endonuclease subunit S [Candidatus Eisenbacteria bacterium]|uniref:Restriction endonuclease subunit S n=1 Tax=Eiseniibacteriota bacterium TaxID=2212470 RepID=A0ABV6YJC0_UNCEI